MGLCPVGVDVCSSFSFISKNKLKIDHFTLPAEEQLTLISLEVAEDGERQARCQLTGQNMVSAEIHLPLSLKGEFYECQSDHSYSLQEIMSSTRLSTRRFYSTNVKHAGGSLIFSPVYEIKAIMQSECNRLLSSSFVFLTAWGIQAYASSSAIGDINTYRFYLYCTVNK